MTLRSSRVARSSFGSLRALLLGVAAVAVLGLGGCEGSAGVAGKDGAPGENGTDGVDGEDGMNGEDGTDGVDGKDGSPGANGNVGADGLDGAPGQQGMPGQDGTDGTPGKDGSPGFPAATFYISNNAAANLGSVDRLNESFAFTKTFLAGNNEGIELDISGNLVQAGDIGAPATPGSLRTACGVARRAADAGYGATDRQLGGMGTDLTGLVNPKGFAIAHKAGLVIVANFNAMNLKVFGTAAAGNAPPVATTALAGNAWDVAYDEVNDRLFVALTNGNLAVFDKYVGGGFGQAGASRTITPADANGMKISTNLHGIVYSAENDTIIVSDVGAATMAQSMDFNKDGSIYVIDKASGANGNVTPKRTIKGDKTTLGNPVDIILTGTDLRVAEKANNLLLVFRDIFDGQQGDIAPDYTAAQTGPESIAIASTLDPKDTPDVTDIEDASTIVLSVATTSNPAAGDPATGVIARLGSNLKATQTTFSSGISLENLTFDRSGDAFVTYDDGNNLNGGIAIINRLAKSRAGGTVSPSRDRFITGAATGLVSPKGLDVVDTLGLVLVAENAAAASSVRVFSTCASGDVAPIAVTPLPARPWDVDYDVATDRLFVALVDGTVAVFDQYSLDYGAGGHDRLITPADGGGAKISVNLHGIIYVQSADALLLSDVGSAASATDGQLFVIFNASSASGNVATSVRINGPQSLLGNPVDISFDGQDLFVAEKSNNAVLRFDDIFDSAGGDIAPSASLARTGPESVALVPAYLSGNP